MAINNYLAHNSEIHASGCKSGHMNVPTCQMKAVGTWTAIISHKVHMSKIITLLSRID